MPWQHLPDRNPPPTRLGDALDRVLGRLGLPDATGVEVIFGRWSEIVGEPMAARTEPLKIDGETLVVSCDEPAVASHVRFLEAQLVDRFAELSGERRIRRVEVRVRGRRAAGSRRRSGRLPPL